MRIGSLMMLVMLMSVGVLGMAALSADAEIDRKAGGLQSYPVEASAQIYKGAIVCINSSGYLVAGADTSGYLCAGIAYENVLGTTQGAKFCRVYTEGVFKLTAISIAQTQIGDAMYVYTDKEFDETSTNSVLLGVLMEYVSATSGWVDISKRLT